MIVPNDSALKGAKGQISARHNWLVLMLYLVLALVLTYPLILHFSDHVPGSETWGFDEFSFLWNYWWFKHAVFDLGINPLQTNYIFYPVGTSLVLYTFALLNAVVSIPLEFVFGYPAASNTLILFSFVVSAFGTFLLARYLLEHSGTLGLAQLDRRTVLLASIIAGIIFGFTSSRYVYASLGHYNFVSSQYVPFFALFLIKAMRERKLKNGLLAGLFGALAVLTDTTYAVFLTLLGLFLVGFGLWDRQLAPGFLKRLGILAVAAGVLASPILAPSVAEFLTAGYTMPGWGHAEKLLVDLFGFVSPTSLHPLNRNWVQELDLVRQGISRFADVNTVFLGYVTLALAILGAVLYRRALRVWIVSGLTFAILALGPLLYINGQSHFDLDGLQVTFPLPFLLLHYIPFLRENRVPNRFGILVVLSLAVLAAFAVAWLFQKVRSQRAGRTGSSFVAVACLVVIGGAILFEHAAVPLPLSDARVPDVYRQISQDPGDYAILSLPLGLRNSFGTLGAEDTRTQYYQSVHEKRLLSGNISRNPQFLFDYFDRIPFFHSLSEIELYHEIPPDVLARDKAEAPALLSFFNIRYVVLNTATAGRLPYSDTRAAAADYIQKVLPLGDKVYDRGGTVAYRVADIAPLVRQEVRFGTEAAHVYEAEGWDRDETIANEAASWVNSQSARLLLPLRQVGDYSLTLRMLPYSYPELPAQTAQIVVNGRSVQTLEFKPGWGDYTVNVPATSLQQGMNTVDLEFEYAVRPRDVVPANFAIGNTGVKAPADVVVNSGDLGSIKVNGHEVSLLGRGYNVVALDPKTGAVLSSKVFDTGNDRSQSRAMSDFLDQVPSGSIVAVAKQEEVAASLGDRTVAALRSIGAQIDIRKNAERSHAIVGVKGAAPGSALEESNEGASFIAVGHSPDERTLAAAVSSLVFEKVQ